MILGRAVTIPAAAVASGTVVITFVTFGKTAPVPLEVPGHVNTPGVTFGVGTFAPLDVLGTTVSGFVT